MAIVSEQELRLAVSDVPSSTVRNYLNRKTFITEASRTGKVTVFLSHSHKDANVVEKAVTLFSNLGVEVYVDWKDPSMPEVTNGETAGKIKERIKASKKFVLLASPAAIISNWVNWELGFGDAHRYLYHIALFPFLKSEDRSWGNAEYLQIYPHIETDRRLVNYSYQDVWVVKYPNGNTELLTDWLKR